MNMAGTGFHKQARSSLPSFPPTDALTPGSTATLPSPGEIWCSQARMQHLIIMDPLPFGVGGPLVIRKDNALVSSALVVALAFTSSHRALSCCSSITSLALSALNLIRARPNRISPSVATPSADRANAENLCAVWLHPAPGLSRLVIAARDSSVLATVALRPESLTADSFPFLLPTTYQHGFQRNSYLLHFCQVPNNYSGLKRSRIVTGVGVLDPHTSVLSLHPIVASHHLRN
jgi:hypothetical protein